MFSVSEKIPPKLKKRFSNSRDGSIWIKVTYCTSLIKLRYSVYCEKICQKLFREQNYYILHYLHNVPDHKCIWNIA